MVKLTLSSQTPAEVKMRITETSASTVNALRRSLLSDIDVPVFHPSEKKGTIAITRNTSLTNNEVLKQRMACIPLSLTDQQLSELESFEARLDISNTTNGSIGVTTNDLVWYQNGQKLPGDQQRLIVPVCPISGRPVTLLTLRPPIPPSTVGDSLVLQASIALARASDDACFNVVSKSTFSAVPDETRGMNEWKAKREKLIADGIEEEQITIAENDWFALDAKRYTIPGSYDFVARTIGTYDVTRIVHKGVLSVQQRIRTAISNMESGNLLIEPAAAAMANAWDIEFQNEDHTLGGIIETQFHTDLDSDAITYCGFSRPHPQQRRSVLRLAFRTSVEKSDVVRVLIARTQAALTEFAALEDLLPVKTA